MEVEGQEARGCEASSHLGARVSKAPFHTDVPALNGSHAGQSDPAPNSLLAALFNPMLFRVYSLTYRNRALCFRGDCHMPYS